MSELEHLLPPDCQLVNWESLETEWQKQINRTIIAPTPPAYLVYPPDAAALGTVMEAAANHGWKVLPCGRGSKLSWGGIIENQIHLLVSTAKLNRVVEHAVGDLTVTVEGGVKLADLQQTLSQYGQFLPLDPAYPESATIGGIVATGDTGSWRVGYGGVRDLVLGLSFVRADGKIAKAGGRVVKNVAGYDLMKLFTGSYGTLGIITQVTFRLYPLPTASRTVVLTGDKEKIASLRHTLVTSGLTPTAGDILSPGLVQKLSLGEGMGLVVRFQSIPASVKEQGAKVASFGQELGLEVSLYEEKESEAELWQDLARSCRVPTPETAICCKIGILPSAAVTLLQKLDTRGLGTIGINNGLGQFTIKGETYEEDIKAMRSLCEAHRGFLTILEAPPTIKQELEPWGYTGNALVLMGRIKEQFDPENILSPGRFVGGI